MLRVGIVAEGITDFLVLETVMRAIHPDIEYERLHPAETLISGFGNGWRGVKAWCEKNGARLEVIMNGVIGRPLHLIVIHADCSMADKVGAERPCPPASETSAALVAVVEQEWLKHPEPLPFIVVAAPSKSSDAWVIATFDPPYAKLAELECDFDAESEFVRRKLLKRKDGAVKKSARIYEPLAARIADRFEDICACCTEAHGFRLRFESAFEQLGF